MIPRRESFYDQINNRIITYQEMPSKAESVVFDFLLIGMFLAAAYVFMGGF